jgi:hypothetical protein
VEVAGGDRRSGRRGHRQVHDRCRVAPEVDSPVFAGRALGQVDLRPGRTVGTRDVLGHQSSSAA